MAAGNSIRCYGELVSDDRLAAMAEKSRDKSCGVCLQSRLGKVDSRAKLWHPSGMPTCILRDLHPTMAIQQGSGQERRQRMPGVPHEIQLHHSEQILDRRKRGEGAAYQQLPSSTGQETLQIFRRRTRRMPVRKKLLLFAHDSRSNRFHRLHSILDELHSRQSTQLERRNARRLLPSLRRSRWLQIFQINSRAWNITELCIRTLGLRIVALYVCLYLTCISYLHGEPVILKYAEDDS